MDQLREDLKNFLVTNGVTADVGAMLARVPEFQRRGLMSTAKNAAAAEIKNRAAEQLKAATAGMSFAEAFASLGLAAAEPQPGSHVFNNKNAGVVSPTMVAAQGILRGRLQPTTDWQRALGAAVAGGGSVTDVIVSYVSNPNYFDTYGLPLLSTSHTPGTLGSGPDTTYAVALPSLTEVAPEVILAQLRRPDGSAFSDVSKLSFTGGASGWSLRTDNGAITGARVAAFVGAHELAFLGGQLPLTGGCFRTIRAPEGSPQHAWKKLDQATVDTYLRLCEQYGVAP